MLVLVGLVLNGVATHARPQNVADARDRYNDGQFDDAIATASAVWQETGSDAAAVVLARAKLERFRALEEPSDLNEARVLLRAVDPSKLSHTEQVEWEIGVASTLYLQGLYGPASELLDRLLRQPGLTQGNRDRLLDWWASAVDRVAQEQPLDRRVRTYERLTERLETALGQDAALTAGTYWLVVAARGAGELQRAWDLGVAGWVRAPRTGSGSETLRSDLDRLMLQGIIPDLAVSHTGRARDDNLTIARMAELAGEWEVLKTAWATAP